MERPLNICDRFFAELEETEILYCHWKSNSRLNRALSGGTDLDILVNIDDRSRFIQTINRFDLKQICSPRIRQHQAIEDYLGFDPESGKLFHLHTHYKLIIGPKHVKNYHLPIEKVILDNCTTSGLIKIPCAEAELLILIIRSSLKFDVFSILNTLIRKNYHFLPETIYEEFDFLLQNYDESTFISILDKFQLPFSIKVLVGFLTKIRRNKLRLKDIYLTKRHILKTLRPYKTGSCIESFSKSVYLSLFQLPLITNVIKPRRKTLPSQGRFFALIGADGAGKSSLTHDLTIWLSWKLQVSSVYFGIPKFKYRAYTLLYNSINNVISFPFFKPLAPIAIKTGYMRWILIARHRVRIYRDSLKKVAHGEIVIADRYPLKYFWPMAEPMDGPRISSEFPDLEYPSHIEQRLYSKIGYPDKIFVLKTDLHELTKRQKGTSSHQLNKKVTAINGLSENRYMSLVDSNMEYKKVLLDIKARIWEMLY